MKCIVKNCQNHEHEGRFIGQLCSPCFGYLSTEEGVHSQAYRNVQKLVEQEREECAKIANEWQEDVLNPLYQCDCATAIRRRGKP
jgi:hypothetical protein